jgi:hypothetical protein
MSRDGGDAGYRPRVRSAYYERVYVHSPEGQYTDRRRRGAVQDLFGLIARTWRVRFGKCATSIP